MRVDNKTNNSLSKISIIGAGFSGASIAFALMMQRLAERIVLIDINKTVADAEAADIAQGLPEISGTDVISGGYEHVRDSSMIVITAGRGRKPGETRMDLLESNLKITKSCADEILKHGVTGVVLVISNPVDKIAEKMTEWLALGKGRVFGTGCLLDTSRLRYLLAKRFSVPIGAVEGYIEGEHGPTQKIVWDSIKIDGKPCRFSDEEKEKISQTIRNMGSEIIAGKNKTQYGIASCVCLVASAMAVPGGRILPLTAVYSNGDPASTRLLRLEACGIREIEE